MCEHGNEILLDLPDDMCTWKQNRTVAVDECIAFDIKALWEAGYETLGCCCGHGKQSASVIVAEGYEMPDIVKMMETVLIPTGKPWSILQWKLTEVEAYYGPREGV